VSAITSREIQIPRMISATPMTIAPFDMVIFGCWGLYVFRRVGKRLLLGLGLLLGVLSSLEFYCVAF
jgi:hypothetical protein